MAKKKNFMISTGFVGLTALALTISPALADPNTETDLKESNELTVVHEVDTLGKDVSIVEADFELPENVDFSTFSAAVEKDAENVKVEDVLDEQETKVGEKVILTIEEQGTWVFENDLEGKLVQIDFTPLEGFEGDPVLDYVAEREGEKLTGTIVLDYPNDEKAEEVEPLTADEVVELEKEETDTEESDEAHEFLIEDEKVEETDSNVDSDVEDKASVVKVMARTFNAPAAPVAPAPAAPAAPVPAEGLEPNFAVPELTGESNGGPATLTFGKNGDKLPAGSDANTTSLIIGTGADQESVISNGGKQLDVPQVGTFKVNDGGNSFTFEPVSGYSGTVIGHYVVQDTVGNYSNEGRLVVAVSPSADNKDATSPGADNVDNNDVDVEDPTVVNPDEPVNGDPLAEDPTVADDNDTVNDDNYSETNSNVDREALPNTGVESAPVGIAAAVLAAIGGAVAFVSSRFKKNNI